MDELDVMDEIDAMDEKDAMDDKDVMDEIDAMDETSWGCAGVQLEAQIGLAAKFYFIFGLPKKFDPPKYFDCQKFGPLKKFQHQKFLTPKCLPSKI